MLIGIFGDSFADKNIIVEAKHKLSWVDHLKNKPNLKITNFALNATGLDYSYKIFLKEHKNFEKIIFIASQPNRWHLPILEKIGSTTWITSLENYKNLISKFIGKNTNKKNFIQIELKLTEAALMHWYKKLYVSQRTLLHDYLVYKKIKSLHSNTLYLRSFYNPDIEKENFIPYDMKLRNNQNLNTISTLDKLYYKHQLPSHDLKDYRQNHMNQENNKIFADKINRWIITNQISLDINDFVYPVEKEEDLWSTKD